MSQDTYYHNQASHEKRAIVPYKSHALDLLRAQNLKAHDDESKNSDDDDKFHTFAEELDRNWNDLIAYD